LWMSGSMPSMSFHSRVRETGQPDPMSYQRFVNRKITGPKRPEAAQYVAGKAATKTGR
jgi:hypothetical protein